MRAPTSESAYQAVVQLLGDNIADRLRQQLGGVSVKLPKLGNERSTVFSQLVAAIGPESTDKLLKHLSGEQIYIPKGQDALLAQRNREILAAYQAGESTNQIARRLQLSTRRVRDLIKS